MSGDALDEASVVPGPAVAYRGARVLVDGEDAPRPAELLVRDGRIVRVAEPGAIRDADETVELDGLVVLPGFVDGHCHLELTVQAIEHHVPLHGHRSLAEMLDVLAAARRARPEGWIVGRGPFGLQRDVAEGRLPHRAELDRVSPTQPIVVLAGLHVACLNTAAMRELGLADPDALPDWITVHRDADGPTGVFTEVWDRLPTCTVEEAMAALRAHAVPVFSRQGTTSLSTISTSADDVRAMHRLAQSGELPFRVRWFTHVPRTASLDEVLAWGPESGFGDERLRFGGVKIFVDGEGGDGLGHARDDVKWAPEELARFVDRADAAGVQLMMHAVTPRAIRLACDAVIAARRERPARVRHRIEHGGDYVDLADLPSIAAAGVGLVATPHFATSSDADREGFQPLASLVAAGHRVIGATDSTGTVPDAVGPLANIAGAAGRIGTDGGPSPERIPVRDAVRMFTSWAAEGVGEEREKGRIAPGLRADLVVLDADPYSVAPDGIGGIGVERTIVGGRTVAERAR
ncbi:amidohydrolase [Agromyces mediolanus]|uniref:amidohydrolase n=1 Tax=Agromyces mediolanus TaxID=41986 RepID=UPI001E3C9025|nr:amidohydrolase family protein [Agromyces mediolanus]MCD1572437.1 amidohydrolase family protein [Agromyces mediolanus]